MVSAKGLSPTRAKVEALLALGPQSSPAGAQRLLGMFSYDRKLVPRFADITAPLNALTSSNREPCASAFDGSGARMDEEGDPARLPPALVQYPGVRWPVYAYSRDRPGQPAPAELKCMAAAAAYLELELDEEIELESAARRRDAGNWPQLGARSRW
ncbi:hypothetical protein GPECTOR_13g687 [Gonium pectorale]|uniref:Uncharacterized protein n=1 Tax=Gonium pectorale TaxID=33097 RepID=A0A150GPE8_GONPE|nr:hypothetical protein GPECTOR_13g687 [Gonium pectorale]|eukprot:KXZ51200.1 hypothetical protein GPECTOR_13g687 [Gonium pectorale]